MWAPPPEARYRALRPLNSLYLSGRAIGDEYRYILDRKYAEEVSGQYARTSWFAPQSLGDQ